jgi:hypothetical protein
MKTGEAFVNIISICLAFPVMIIVHLGKGFWAGGLYFWDQHSRWWSDIRDDFR